MVSEDLMITYAVAYKKEHNQVSGYKNVLVSVLSMPSLEYYVIVCDYDLGCTIKLFCAAVRRVLSDSWGTQV